jgi:hypothetical protein
MFRRATRFSQLRPAAARIPVAEFRLHTPGANRIDIFRQSLMPGKASEVQPFYSLK